MTAFHRLARRHLDLSQRETFERRLTLGFEGLNLLAMLFLGNWIGRGSVPWWLAPLGGRGYAR